MGGFSVAQYDFKVDTRRSTPYRGHFEASLGVAGFLLFGLTSLPSFLRRGRSGNLGTSTRGEIESTLAAHFFCFAATRLAASDTLLGIFPFGFLF